jgi:hypothetical protein
MAYQTDDDGNIIYRSDDDGPRYRMVQTDDGWGKEYTTPEQEQAEAAQQQAQREAEAIAEQQRQRDAEAAAKAEKDRLYAAVKNANPEIAAFADRVLSLKQGVTDAIKDPRNLYGNSPGFDGDSLGLGRPSVHTVQTSPTDGKNYAYNGRGIWVPAETRELERLKAGGADVEWPSPKGLNPVDYLRFISDTLGTNAPTVGKGGDPGLNRSTMTSFNNAYTKAYPDMPNVTDQVWGYFDSVMPAKKSSFPVQAIVLGIIAGPLFGPLAGAMGGGILGSVGAGALIGGTISELTGGNFEDGAISGALTAGVTSGVNMSGVGSDLTTALKDAGVSADTAANISKGAVSTGVAATKAILTGKDVGDAIESALASAGVSTAVGELDLGKDATRIITPLITTVINGGDLTKTITNLVGSYAAETARDAVKDAEVNSVIEKSIASDVAPPDDAQKDTEQKAVDEMERLKQAESERQAVAEMERLAKEQQDKQTLADIVKEPATTQPPATEPKVEEPKIEPSPTPDTPFGGNNPETSLVDILNPPVETTQPPATETPVETTTEPAPKVEEPTPVYVVSVDPETNTAVVVDTTTGDVKTVPVDPDTVKEGDTVNIDPKTDTIAPPTETTEAPTVKPEITEETLTPEQQWAKNNGVLEKDDKGNYYIDWTSYDIDSGVGTGSTGPEQTEQEVRDQLGTNFDLVYPNGYPGKDVAELPEVVVSDTKLNDEPPDNWDPALMGDWSTFNKPEPPDNWDPALMGDWSKLNPEERSTAVGGTKGTGGGIKTPTVTPTTPPVTPPVKPPVTPTVKPTTPAAPAAAASASPFMTVSDLNKPVDIKYYTDMASQGILPQQPETNAAQFKLEKDRAEKEKEAENSGEGDFAYGGLINGYDDEFTIEDLLNMLRS